MSRPRWSVPSQWAALGGARVAAALVAIGSCVCSTLAKMAVNTMRTMMKPPAAPSGFLRQKRSSASGLPGSAERAGAATTTTPLAAIAHPRVEHTVEHVHGEIGDDHHHGDEHDEGLHDGVVAPQDGLHEKARDAGQVEDGLRDHEPADEERELDADDRDHGQDGVLERVV